MHGAIGVFDSGMGGLTVLKALRAELPEADFVYLGDTARLPYGTKTPETVRRYSGQAARLLVDRGVESLVIACNTASGLALQHLQEVLAPLPIFGVVEPGARAAAEVMDESGVLVLATESTVAGGAYQASLSAIRSDAAIEARACPLWVTLAEQGITDGTLTQAIVEHDMREDGPKTVLLGCTHFPVFRDFLTEHYPNHRFVDSAATTAVAVREELGPMLKNGEGEGSTHFLVTDGIERFSRVGSYFLGEEIGNIELVDL